MRGLIYDTWVEMVQRRLIWIYAAVTVIAILLIMASKSMSIKIEVNDDPNDPASALVEQGAVGSLDAYCSFLVFLTILGTAGLIPSMLERGRAEYYLSKPISRTSLFLYKFASIWSVYGATIVVGGLVTFAIFFMAWRYFDAGLVYIFALNLVSLFIWLSVTAFAGILTGSYAVSIMVAFAMWIAQSLLRYHDMLGQVIQNKLVTGAVSGLYYILPKTSELSDMTTKVALGQPVESWLPLWSSLIFAAGLLAVTIALFNRKDY